MEQGTHRRRHLALALLLVALAAAGCKRGGADEPAAGGEERAPLVNRRVPGAPLTLQIPADWRLDEVDPEPLGPAPGLDGGPPAAKGLLELRSRTLLSARAPSSRAGERLSAWLLLQHDPWLPAGTTTTEYLDAQRASNHQVVPDMKHVDAERSRRQGRPAYYVRDEWAAPMGEEAVLFSQETLLLIEAEEQRLHGYAVTVTMPKDDREDLAEIVRAMLDSVRFAR